MHHRACKSAARCAAWIVLVWALGLSPGAGARAGEPTSAVGLQSIFAGAVPTSSQDLQAMQAHLQGLSSRAITCTVAVQVGPAQGSGAIVTADGYVLTAAHVVGKPGERARLVLHDGRHVRGETLGLFRTLDAGLIKITDDPRSLGMEAWPNAPMGDSKNLKPGQWCLATGHPGGVQATGSPVVRLGRILSVDPDSAINTDCTLIGGDSGGPLFNMDGAVIGVHSRIGGSLTLNLHVPIHAYRETWDRLVAGEAWGHAPGARPYIGVQGDPNSDAAKIAQVFRGAPAEKAGVKTGDVITRFAGKDITTFDSLRALVESQEPGAKVELEILRDAARVRLEVVVGSQRE